MTAAASQKTRRECFAAVPFRALGDARLTRTELAILGVIAAHDRFQANGRGCDAGRPRIAHLANCDMGTMSRAITQLELLGYVKVYAHPGDGRKRIYCVIYADKDFEMLSGKTNPTPRQKTRRKLQGRYEKGDEVDTDRNEIDDAENSGFVDSTAEFRTNIFPEREEYIPKTGTHAPQRPHYDNDGNCRSITSRACEIERRLKQGKITREDAVDQLYELHLEADEQSERAHCERINSKIDPDSDW